MPFEETFAFCGGILIVSLLNNTIESSETSSLFVFAIIHSPTLNIEYSLFVFHNSCALLLKVPSVAVVVRLFWEQPLKMVHNIYNYCGKGRIYLNFKRSANVEEQFLIS